MHVYLKVKIKSLAIEGTFIRKEERKVNINARERKRIKRNITLGSSIIPFLRDNGSINKERGILTESQILRLQKKLERSRNILANPKSVNRQRGLYNHRIDVVRNEARHSLIAYGFLRGLDYNQIENSNKKLDWDKIQRMIETYTENDSRITIQKFAEWKAASGKTVKA